jgi:hypothetical protein
MRLHGRERDHDRHHPACGRRHRFRVGMADWIPGKLPGSRMARMTEDEREREVVLVRALLQIGALCDFKCVATKHEVEDLVAAIDSVASVALLQCGAVDTVS